MEKIDPFEFDVVSTKLREFFKQRGLIEASLQDRVSILAACENPDSIVPFEYLGQKWALPQTNQMWLEYEILKGYDKLPPVQSPGFFTSTTSYRAEKNPIPGRHNLIFPMMEFEITGGFDQLIQFEKDLLEHLGYGPQKNYKEITYDEVCKLYNVTEIEHEEEQRLYKDFGPVVFIKKFPQTSAFWNMELDENALVNKCDVILSGMESIGSAARSSDIADMRHRFNTTSDGKYKTILYDLFGQERVEEELNSYLDLTFRPRSGAGCGMTRIISSMRKEGLLTTNKDANSCRLS